ncbi:MAG: thioredoxin TrxC [Acidobacteria bacterium]|nr:thioredoxin TrxC [Acidobacteriota bacterium]
MTSAIVRCPNCGTRNRVPAQVQARCGRCHSDLDLGQEFSGKPFETTDFQADVIRSDVPVLVDFWAPWCQPCLALAPVLDELAGRWVSRLRVVKVNVDRHSDLAAEYGIRGIPTLFLFREGKKRASLDGLHPISEIEAWLEQNLK